MSDLTADQVQQWATLVKTANAKRTWSNPNATQEDITIARGQIDASLKHKMATAESRQ